MTFNKTLIAVALLASLSACSNKELHKGVHEAQNNINHNHALIDAAKKLEKAPFTLEIAHINDTHSHFDGVKSSFTLGKGKEKVYNEFGGYPRLLTAANEIKQKAADNKNPILFLHGGDAWQGTAYFKLNKGSANAALLSNMGLDAMVLGNHEFDLDTAALANFINGVNFPVLANNIDTIKDNALNSVSVTGKLKPYQLFGFNGATKTPINDDQIDQYPQVVAVIGVVLEDMPIIATGTGKVEFFNEINATQKTIDALKAKGVNKVVVLSHIGHAKDIELAKGTTGIDIIVGGHSHSLLGDFTDLDQGHDGTYAELINQATGHNQTCIVQAGKYAQAIGDVTVTFNKMGDLSTCAGKNTLLSNSTFYQDATRTDTVKLTGSSKEKVSDFIKGNPKITETAEEAALRNQIDTDYKPELEAKYGATIAVLPQEINHERRPTDNGTDNHGSDLAPIVGQALVTWANFTDVKTVTGKTAQIGLVGAGGLRNSLEAGELRKGNVTLELMPFSNGISELTVSGKVIKDLIASTITATLPAGSHAGKFPYVGGMRYTFNETVAHKSGEVTQLDINVGTEEQPKWQAMQDDQNYVVVVNSYNANGNDGWNALAEAQLQATDRVDIVMQGDQYIAYSVTNLQKQVSAEGAVTYSPVYTNGAPSCKGDNHTDTCNTDAMSFVKYAEMKKSLQALPYETTTVNYKM